jgi:O-antigen ligase
LENNNLSNGRFSIWEDAISYYSSKPIFGIGLKNYYEISGYDVHNTYIQFLVEAGIVGFVVLITSVLKILIGSIAGLKCKYKDGLSGMDTPTIVGVYLLFFLIMYGFVGNTFIDYAPMSLFMISVGLISSDLYSMEKVE